MLIKSNNTKFDSDNDFFIILRFDSINGNLKALMKK